MTSILKHILFNRFFKISFAIIWLVGFCVVLPAQNSSTAVLSNNNQVTTTSINTNYLIKNNQVWLGNNTFNQQAKIYEYLIETWIDCLRISPNPVEDLAIVEICALKTYTETIQISDVYGQLFLSIEVKLSEGTNLIQLILNELPPGYYILKAVKANETIVFYKKP